MKYIVGVFVALFLSAWAMASEPVLKSSSGICHCPGGQYYGPIHDSWEHLKVGQAFPTLGACLESGGREPKQGQGKCPKPPQVIRVTVPDLVKCSVLLGRYEQEALAVPATHIVRKAIDAGCWMGSGL